MINAESIRMMKSPIVSQFPQTAQAMADITRKHRGVGIDALMLINTVLEDTARVAEKTKSNQNSGMTKDRIIATCMACGESTVDMDDYQGLVDLYNSEVWNYFTIIRWPNGDSHGKVVVKVDRFAHRRMNVTD